MARTIPDKYVDLPPREGSEIRDYAAVEVLMYTVKGDRILTRKVANNTWLRRGPDGIQLWLHKTPIITWHRDNTITLRTGGWQTITTKDRLNRWLPSATYAEQDTPKARLSLQVQSFRQVGGSHWYVRTAYADPKVRWPRKKQEIEGWVPFYEEMQIDLVTCTLSSGDHDASSDIEFNEQIDKQIKKFLKDLPGIIKNGKTAPNRWPENDEDAVKHENYFQATCVRDKVIPYQFLLRVATDLGYRHPEVVSSTWHRDMQDKQWAQKYATSRIRKWLRGHLYRGAVAKNRAVRLRTGDE